MPIQGTAATWGPAQRSVQSSSEALWRELEELGANIPAIAPFAPTAASALELIGAAIAAIVIMRAVWRLLRRKGESDAQR